MELNQQREDTMQPFNNNNAHQQVKFHSSTLETQYSRQDTDADHDENFKTERQKYLQQKKQRAKQIKKARRQQFGSSSSESEQEVEKAKPKPTLVKGATPNQAKAQPKIQQNSPSKQIEESEEFKARHQAYLKQKMMRKKQMIQEKRQQFGTSSSGSDDSEEQVAFGSNDKTCEKGIQIKIPVKEEKQLPKPKKTEPKQRKQPVSQIIQGSPALQKKQSLRSKPSFERSESHKKSSSYKKVKNQEIKKITVMVQSKKNLNWIEETLIIENKKLKFVNQNLEFMSAFILKIKLFFSRAANTKEYYKIKVTHKNGDFFFACSVERLIQDVPEYYYVFARIIQDKMLLMGVEPKKIDPATLPNVMNLKGVPENVKSSSNVFGNILKKSQVLGIWENRFISIGMKGIVSYKKPSQKPSMSISAESIKQLWTRFDVQDNSMLNLKIMHNSTKTEFGIPLTVFTDENNWLYCFYKIIMQKK